MIKYRILSLMILTIAFFSCKFTFSNKINASGTIEIIELNISAKIADIVKSMLVNEGDNVKSGQKIAEINHAILDLQLIQAQSNYQNAEINYKRALELFSKGNAPLKDKDDAVNRYIVAKSSYEIIAKQIDDCTIKTPIDGIITHKLVEEGEFVNFGTPIYSISKINPVNLTIYVNERDLGRISLGQKAKIKIDTFSNKEFAGKIIYISPNAEFTPKNIQTKEERVKQVFAVKIEIPNQDGVLKPGMPADAVIEY